MMNVDGLQRQYRERLEAVVEMKAHRRVKVLLLEGLREEMRQMVALQDQLALSDPYKARSNCEVLSTTFSECPSSQCAPQREVEDLEERILALRMVKFEQNEHIEALEEELDAKERAALARSEYHDHLKRKVLLAMQNIEAPKDRDKDQEEEKSLLNKSIDAVAGILTFRWW